MVVYIYYITAAGNSISSQLGSSAQGNRYCTAKAGGMARPSRTKSHLSGHSPPASRVGPALYPSASLDAPSVRALYTSQVDKMQPKGRHSACGRREGGEGIKNNTASKETLPRNTERFDICVQGGTIYLEKNPGSSGQFFMQYFNPQQIPT